MQINQNIEKNDDNLKINQKQEIKENLDKNQNPNNLEKNENLEIKRQDPNIIKDNEQSFNQLLSLQLLIQKQSGLKELCKQIINFTFNFSHKRKR